MGDNNDIRGGNGTTNQAFFNANDGSWPTWSGGTSTSGAGWIYEASVIDPTNSFEAFYQNGVSVGTLSSPGNASGIKYTNGLTQTDIGEDAKTNSTNYLTGSVTEVRIESVARSADWVTLCYANQQAAQTFVGPIVPPTVPVLASPTNGATNQLLASNLTWNSVSAATSYAVMVSTSSAFGTTILSQSGITAPSVTLSALANSTTYYWQVSATNLTLTSAWSSVWSFTTSAIPLPIAPMLSSPTNGAANTAVALTLAWNTVYIATSYGVQVSTSSAFGSTVFAQSGMTASTAMVTALANSATYYWRANAANISATGPGRQYGTSALSLLRRRRRSSPLRPPVRRMLHPA